VDPVLTHHGRWRELSRLLAKGRSYTLAGLGASLSCDVTLQRADAELDAYWADPAFANGVLTDFAEFPNCLPGGVPGYCPRT
jgi:hypothetical protein